MIRTAVPGEAAEVGELYHAVWHETHAALMHEQDTRRRTLSYFSERMLPLIRTTIVGYRDTNLAGFASWHGNYLGQLFVREPYRGSVLATELLAAAECAMARAGTTRAELHCVVGNDRARRFYARNGWHDEGVAAEWLAGRERDVEVPFWRMIKQLS